MLGKINKSFFKKYQNLIKYKKYCFLFKNNNLLDIYSTRYWNEFVEEIKPSNEVSETIRGYISDILVGDKKDFILLDSGFFSGGSSKIIAKDKGIHIIAADIELAREVVEKVIKKNKNLYIHPLIHKPQDCFSKQVTNIVKKITKNKKTKADGTISWRVLHNIFNKKDRLHILKECINATNSKGYIAVAVRALKKNDLINIFDDLVTGNIGTIVGVRYKGDLKRMYYDITGIFIDLIDLVDQKTSKDKKEKLLNKLKNNNNKYNCIIEDLNIILRKVGIKFKNIFEFTEMDFCIDNEYVDKKTAVQKKNVSNYGFILEVL